MDLSLDGMGAVDHVIDRLLQGLGVALLHGSLEVIDGSEHVV
jgi:hypothetical protein